MPSFTLRPVSQGSYDQWTLGAGGSKSGAMSDASDSTYINTGQNAQFYDSYNMADLPADAGSVDSPVALVTRATFTGDIPSTQRFIYTPYSGGSGFLVSDDAIYQTSGNFTNGPDGGPWSVSSLNNCQAGVYANCGVNDFAYCYDIWFSGTYQQAGAMFIAFLQWVGPILFGSNLLMRDMLRAAAYSARTPRNGTRIVWSPNEIREAYRQCRDGVRPRSYLLLGRH